MHPADFYREVCSGQHCKECQDCREGECQREEWEEMRRRLRWEVKNLKEVRK